MTKKNSPPTGDSLAASSATRTTVRSLRALFAAGSVVSLLVVPAAQASAASSTITLTETSYYPASAGPIYTYLNTVFNNFEKSHPGIIVKREDIPNSPEYLTTIADEASAGTLPDVLMLDNPMVPTIASYNVLTPLSSLGKTAIPSLGAAQQAEAKFNGTIYGYPLYTNTIALFYNKAMLSAANITAADHLGTAPHRCQGVDQLAALRHRLRRRELLGLQRVDVHPLPLDQRGEPDRPHLATVSPGTNSVD